MGASRTVAALSAQQLVEPRRLGGAGRSELLELHRVHRHEPRRASRLRRRSVTGQRRHLRLSLRGRRRSTPKQAVSSSTGTRATASNLATNKSYPFYPIPAQGRPQPHWVEGGAPGNVDQRNSSDRHLLIVDRDNRHLYELYNVYYDGARWHAGSGAFFDLNTNDRRPDGWTSADAAGLAILPGLVRYDEAYGTGEIGHAFRVTVRATNGYVYPASHRAGHDRRAADGRAAAAEGEHATSRASRPRCRRSSAPCRGTV